MAIFKKDCTSIAYEEGTLGGRTFYVKHPKWDDKERAICFRPVKNIPTKENAHRHGAMCERPAGWQTDHEGEGGCRTHSGNAGRPPTHGRRAGQTTKSLHKRVIEFMNDDANILLDLNYELATMKVLFRDVIDLFPADPSSKDYPSYLHRTTQMIQATGSLVDKISRVEARNTITANQVIYLQATVADILMKYIPEESQREFALKELQSRIPTGATILEG